MLQDNPMLNLRTLDALLGRVEFQWCTYCCDTYAFDVANYESDLSLC